MKIYFDMDGVLGDFYGVDGWLDYILAEDVYPYANAKPLCNFSVLAKTIHKLEKIGYEFGVISWLAKNATEDYDERVTEAKLAWLRKHLPSVEFTEINIVKYGTPKHTCGCGVLFDDEEPNRKDWEENDGIAFDAENLIEILKSLLD